MRLQKDRIKYRTLNMRFRRARRLYVYKMRFNINHKRDEALDYMVDRMKERGIYSKGTDDRGCRQSILSHLYRIEGHGLSWHEWLFSQCWDAYKGYSKSIMRKQA